MDYYYQPSKRSFQTRNGLSESFFNGLPNDVIISILRPFQGREESFLISLVCKTFHSLVQRDKQISLLDTLNYYANQGNLEVLKWFRYYNMLKLETTLCWLAARGGHIQVLAWLKESGCPWDSLTCSHAALHGHLNILQWARSYGCPWNESTCSNAARGGHLQVLMWARANGCDWDEYTAAYAAGAGRLEILQWACMNGCLCTTTAANYAAQYGQVHVLEWLRQANAPWNPAECRAVAIRGGQQQVLAWLRSVCYDLQVEEEKEEDDEENDDMDEEMDYDNVE